MHNASSQKVANSNHISIMSEFTKKKAWKNFPVTNSFLCKKPLRTSHVPYILCNVYLPITFSFKAEL